MGRSSSPSYPILVGAAPLSCHHVSDRNVDLQMDHKADPRPRRGCAAWSPQASLLAGDSGEPVSPDGTVGGKGQGDLRTPDHNTSAGDQPQESSEHGLSRH